MCETQGEGKQLIVAFSCADEKFNHATMFSEQWRHATLFTEQWSSEQWSIAPLFRPDVVRSNAQNALKQVRRSKIKKTYFFIFLIVLYSLDDAVSTEFDCNSNFVPDYILQVMLLHV